MQKIKVYLKHIQNLKSNNSKHDLFVFSLLFNCGYDSIYFSNEKIAKILGSNVSSVKRSLNNLKKQGLITTFYPTNRTRYIKINTELCDDLKIDNESEFCFCDMNLKYSLGLSFNALLIQSFIESFYRLNGNTPIQVSKMQDLADTFKLSLSSIYKNLEILEGLNLISIDFQEGKDKVKIIKVNSEIVDNNVENFLIENIKAKKSSLIKIYSDVKTSYINLKKFIAQRLKDLSNFWIRLVELVKNITYENGVVRST